MAVASVLVMMGLYIYVGIAAIVLTGFGTCPPEYNTVWVGRCAKSWIKKGPSVQCDITSKFVVPYLFGRKPLCTTSSVNVVTTVTIVLSLVFIIICICGAKRY